MLHRTEREKMRKFHYELPLSFFACSAKLLKAFQERLAETLINLLQIPISNQSQKKRMRESGNGVGVESKAPGAARNIFDDN